MALISWDDDFSVGVRELDEQHKKLISLINDLHNAMKIGKGKEVLSPLLKSLVEYTQTHFSTEEKYFTRFGYPEQGRHQAEHQKFVGKVGAFQKDFDKGGALLSMDVMNFLKEWLAGHILGSDKRYGPFFNEKGLK